MIVTDPRTGELYDDQTGEIYQGVSSINRNGPTKTGKFRPGYNPVQTSTPVQSQPVQPQSQNDLLNFGGSQDQGTQLFQKIYGNSPTDYAGTFKTGYQNLNQNNVSQDQTNSIAANGVLSLAKPYIDSYMKKNGKLPTEDEVRNFVGTNLTSGYASKFIQGTISPDQVMSQYVNPALEQQAATNQSPANDEINKGILGLNDLNEQLFNAAKNQTISDSEEAYLPQKRGLVEDLAAQNQLGQANSRYSLDALEAAKNKSLSQALGNIAVQRAQGGLNIGTTAQNLLANQRALQQGANQFQQTFGLQRQQMNNALDQQEYERGLQQQQLGLASQLGRQQAEASKPGWAQYLGLGFQGLGALGGLASGLGAAKTAFG